MSTRKNYVFVGVMLPKDLRDRLVQRAEQEDRTLSAQIRQIIVRELKGKK